MARNKKGGLQYGAQILAGAAIMYFLLDFPIRFTQAYDFPVCIGIKSYLPFTLGLFFGLPGILGGVLGAAGTGLLAGVPAGECLTECLCVLAAGLGSWLCWYAFHRDGHVRFEHWREIAIYAAMTAGLSLLCGGIAALILGAGNLLPVAAGYLVTGLLVGLLVNILLGGIFCVAPALPWFCTEREGIQILLTSENPAFGQVNEAIEAEAMAKKMPLKRVFEIENCLEELYIRIINKLPEAEIRGKVEMGSTISMSIRVDGVKFNPFRTEADEDETALAGLKLLRHRALRASYTYAEGQNQIHIVV